MSTLMFIRLVSSPRSSPACLMTFGSAVLTSVKPLRNIAIVSPSRTSSRTEATPLYWGFHSVSHETLAGVDPVGAKADAGAEHRVGHGVDPALVVVRVSQRCDDVADVGEVGLVQRLDQPGVDQLEQRRGGRAVMEIDVDRTGRQLGDGFVVGRERRDLDLDAVLRLERRDDVGADVRVVVEDPQRTGFGFQAILDRLGVLLRSSLSSPHACSNGRPQARARPKRAEPPITCRRVKRVSMVLPQYERLRR